MAAFNSKFSHIFMRWKSCRLLIPMQGPVSRKFRNVSGAFRVAILFVSSKRRRLKARNYAAILNFIPFVKYKKTSFTESSGRRFANSFSGPKLCFRDFRETGSRLVVTVNYCVVATVSNPLEAFMSYEKNWELLRRKLLHLLLVSSRKAPLTLLSEMSALFHAFDCNQAFIYQRL